MTWTKFGDNFTDRSDLAGLSYEDRWHYLSILLLCSRSGRFDGVLRDVDARRCSDHPDPVRAIAQLVEIGLLERTGKDLRVVEIEEHVPPPSVRNKSEQDKIRKRRQRAHAAGDHTMCIAERCPHAAGGQLVTSDVARDIGRDSGTGQDGPIQRVPQITSWETASIPVATSGDELAGRRPIDRRAS